nr:tyrosine-protein kinase CpsD, putative [Tanacetum cinerariifolium]
DEKISATKEQLIQTLTGLTTSSEMALRDLDQQLGTSKEDLTRLTDIPLLGVIPHGTAEEKQTMLHDPRSPIAEAFRAVRVNMQYLAAGLDKRVIGVTSSVPGEGKSFCTVNLAAELAQSGRRVIVLECDMRRPTLAGYFDINPRAPHGLSTYLAGDSTLDEARSSTSIPGLDVLCCGPLPQNPTRLVESPLLTELVQQLREEYDYLLVDIPPLGYVSEFLVLLQHLDAKIYVVRQNYTDRSLISQISEMHRDHNVKQLYMVINDVHFASTYEYRHKANAYKYRARPLACGCIMSGWQRGWAARIALHDRVPVVVTGHFNGNPAEEVIKQQQLTGAAAGFMRRWYGMLLRRTRYFVGVSQSVLRHSAALLPPTTLRTVVYNGIDFREFSQPRPGKALRQRFPGRHIILNIGHLEARKNQQYLLGLAKALRAHRQDFVIGLVGQGPDEASLRTRIAADDLAGHVVLLGYHAPVAPLLQDADLYLHTALSESYGSPSVLRPLYGAAHSQLDVGGAGQYWRADARIICQSGLLASVSARVQQAIYAAYHVWYLCLSPALWAAFDGAVAGGRADDAAVLFLLLAAHHLSATPLRVDCYGHRHTARPAIAAALTRCAIFVYQSDGLGGITSHFGLAGHFPDCAQQPRGGNADANQRGRHGQRRQARHWQLAPETARIIHSAGART